MTRTKKPARKTVEALKHEEASRKNIPTAEYESVMQDADRDPIRVAYERRNPDLDPQLVWRGKDMQAWSDLVVPAPPLFIQEKVHPKVLIDDLLRRSRTGTEDNFEQIDLFADFNGVLDDVARTEFYAHEANWTNRMILGDSLQVMASLAEREGLRGQVQCIYLDPPYGIKFNSNFQWSTTSREVKDGKVEHITREPEQIRAFRDTWRDGIHSYLTYLRDRLTVALDLLAPSGSIFVQIGDENVHRVRALMDEVLGSKNFVSQISVRKTATPSQLLDDGFFYILWYAASLSVCKYRQLWRDREATDWLRDTPGGSWGIELAGERRSLESGEKSDPDRLPPGARIYALSKLTSAGAASAPQSFEWRGQTYLPSGNTHWKTTATGLRRLESAGRLEARGGPPWFVRFHDDHPSVSLTNLFEDTAGKSAESLYVVQTQPDVIQRCMLMTTDPGDLVLDPTCGSGTTAYVAEQWGRRWITIDTSRVALALARQRLMGARFPYYLLADSPEGRARQSEPSVASHPGPRMAGDLRDGFVYERVPHITLKAIANNTEIDAISEIWQRKIEPLRKALNAATGESFEEWEAPLQASDGWSAEAQELHADWLKARRARQEQIDASIAAKADFEYLYDRPEEDRKIVRVAGPLTVESLSPHRVVSFDENDQLIDPTAGNGSSGGGEDFATMVLENLSTAGVQQAHKEDKLAFVSVSPWPGKLVCGEGRYREGETDSSPEKRAGIFVGPEFGTVARADLVEAAREAGDAGFDVLVSCAFNYEARASEFNQLGRIPVLKARMSADLHMSEELKNTGKGNLFVIFGEPDIDFFDAEGDEATDGQIQIRVNGVDVFDPSTGEIRSDSADGIACWFVDSDYNEESFFVRQAYFLGANDPYKALKTTLKAEIDKDAWESLHSDTSRPFDKPESGRIAVKVINHLGDEVMKVLRVG
jgi:adenine-specific DNA-methyltransferase